jgi:hypothetical protein
MPRLTLFLAALASALGFGTPARAQHADSPMICPNYAAQWAQAKASGSMAAINAARANAQTTRAVCPNLLREMDNYQPPVKRAPQPVRIEVIRPAPPRAEAPHPVPVPALSAAEAAVRIQVGTIEGAQDCTIYAARSGQSGLYVDRDAILATDSWQTRLYKDCVQHFEGIRAALEAALASSGRLVIGPGGATLNGRISNVVGGGGPAPSAPAGARGYVASNRMMVTMDVTLRDRNGTITFGAPVIKTIETGYAIQANGVRAEGSQSGEGLYAVIQQQVALAVARRIAFHIAPMQVTAVNGRSVDLSYGAPFLTLGMLVEVNGANGGRAIRYRVVSASEGRATAELYGNGDVSQIFPGSRAEVIEGDDPAANQRRFDKVEIP